MKSTLKIIVTLGIVTFFPLYSMELEERDRSNTVFAINELRKMNPFSDTSISTFSDIFLENNSEDSLNEGSVPIQNFKYRMASIGIPPDDLEHFQLPDSVRDEST